VATATSSLADRMLTTVAVVDDIAEEVVFSAEYEASGPGAYVAPEWLQRCGSSLPDGASKAEEMRAFLAAACAEFPDDEDACAALLWMFAGGLSSRAGHTDRQHRHRLRLRAGPGTQVRDDSEQQVSPGQASRQPLRARCDR
jgi:hypothetical protein